MLGIKLIQVSKKGGPSFSLLAFICLQNIERLFGKWESIAGMVSIYLP